MSASDFQPVTTAQRPIFEAALAVQKRWSCECNFVNVFSWAGVYDTVSTTVAERLVVCNRKVGTILFPFGAWFEPAELEALRAELTARLGGPLVWGDVPHGYVEAHATALREFYVVLTTPDEDDYILRVADTAAIAGHGHQNTRRLIRQFGEQMYGWRAAPVTSANLAAVQALAAQLLATADTDGFLADEAIALQRAFDHFAELGLEGLLISSANGAPLAFSLFSFTTPEVCNVHFEKAARAATGAAQTIRISVARHLRERCVWMNIEQDMGNPGLRRSKRSYLPALTVPRYRLLPRQEQP